MDLQLSLHGRRDLAGQLYRQLHAAIVGGRLAAGTRLPSTRDLAQQLGVSRKTTLDVYERLASEGYLETRAGHGTFVASGFAPPDDALDALDAPDARRAARDPLPDPADLPQLPARAHEVWSRVPVDLAMPISTPPLAFDFRGGITDKTRFPWGDWRRSLNHAIRAQSRGSGEYRDAAGDPNLRVGIARYVGFSRAIACSWQDVVVTNGAQQALDLLARTLVGPGDVVAVEEPGYPPARAAFEALGATVIGVPVDAQGLIVEQLPDAARFVYATPSHQFPLGMPMSLARRVALLDWARRRDAVVLEDDYDCEFRFDGRPLEPLKSLDRDGRVAYVGTFSKTLFPELRIGYAIAPRPLIAPLLKVKQIADWHSGTLMQAALAHFMLDGAFGRHLRRMAREYALRRARIAAWLDGELAPWFAPVAASAGIHVAAPFRAALDEARLLAAAREASIALIGLSAFHAHIPAVPGVLFGYGGIDAPHIDTAMATLARLVKV
ncbi:PLP-dependent aminotransferase family protein [Burkholderia sp. 22PA0099]|uniref:MocR-like pyridoxine biosynthesis transcription factor PdxR n=1 Tax=Burkholderia sp. 22PA0099 TaxID=3237372 RepID=UPI0039C08D3D